MTALEHVDDFQTQEGGKKRSSQAGKQELHKVNSQDLQVMSVILNQETVLVSF